MVATTRYQQSQNLDNQDLVQLVRAIEGYGKFSERTPIEQLNSRTKCNKVDILVKGLKRGEPVEAFAWC
ncbi:MAG: hypothetical protein FJX22_02700 [Alphaproteobacteria bacterium]|nr:hypothetical protein [Alphaproteobacteria bacterium]